MLRQPAHIVPRASVMPMTGPMPLRRRIRVNGAFAVLISLSGCATYSPAPLDLGATGKATLEELTAAQSVAVSASSRLTPDDIARLALDHNPDLVAIRMERGLAHAQVHTAGMLPNPVLTASYAEVLSGPGILPALAAGLTQDLRTIVTLSARRNSATAAAESVDASVLWQEWQIASKAKITAIDLIEGQKQLEVLRRNADIWRESADRTRTAVNQGDATLVGLSADVAAEADAARQLDEFERTQAQRTRDLNALVGLFPSAAVRLAADVSVAPQEPAEAVRDRLTDLANRRPDLIALQLGYRSQEETVRAAVLSQFPVFSLGVAYGRDTGNVKTLGPQVTLDLPIFDRNQGVIGQQLATREKLHAEFTSRLIGARSEAEGLLADRAMQLHQLEERRAAIAQLEPMVAAANAALARGDVDARTVVDLDTALHAKQLEAISLETSLQEQQVALAILSGAGLPSVQMPSPPTLAEQARR